MIERLPGDLDPLTPEERSYLTTRTFVVLQDNTGFLGLAARIAVVVGGQIIRTELAYGDTLHALAKHTRAQYFGTVKEVLETNTDLPEKFQFPFIVNGK